MYRVSWSVCVGCLSLALLGEVVTNSGGEYSSEVGRRWYFLRVAGVFLLVVEMFGAVCAGLELIVVLSVGRSVGRGSLRRTWGQGGVWELVLLGLLLCEFRLAVMHTRFRTRGGREGGCSVLFSLFTLDSFSSFS